MIFRRSTHGSRFATIVALLVPLPLSANADDPKPPEKCGGQFSALPAAFGVAEQQPSTRYPTGLDLEMPFVESSTRAQSGLVPSRFRIPVADGRSSVPPQPGDGGETRL